MNKLRKFFTHPLAYPLVFIVLHIFTYGIFFWMTSQKLPLQWLGEKRASSLNLIWFYKTYWPNWLGIFIIFTAAFKMRQWKYALFYLGAMFWENYFIGWDYMGSYEDFPLTLVQYRVFVTELDFSKAGGHYIIHFGLWLAIMEVVLKVIKISWTLLGRRYVQAK